MLNKLGTYLLVSLLLVFGTMVEFSMVLVAKQKYDWNNKTINNLENPSTIKIQKAYNDQETNSTVEVISQIKEKGHFSNIGIKDEYLKLSQILKYLMLPKSIPPYRKTDIIAFILFSAFYLCFNVIYFAVCLNH